MFTIFSLPAMNIQNFNHDLRNYYAGLDKSKCRKFLMVSCAATALSLYEFGSSYMNEKCLGFECISHPATCCAYVGVLVSGFLLKFYKNAPDTYIPYQTDNQNFVNEVLLQRERINRDLAQDHSCADIIKAQHLPGRVH